MTMSETLKQPVNRMRFAALGRRLLLVPVSLWLLLFSLAPLVFLVVMSLWKSNIFGISTEWTLENYIAFWREPVYRTVLWSTVRISMITTIAALVIGYPIAWKLAQLQGRARAVAVLMFFLPFWTSYLIRTFAWIPILGRNGVINSSLVALGVIDEPIDGLLFSEGAVYLGLIYVYILYMVLPVFLALDKLDPDLIEAAEDLGAGPVQLFTRIILPLSTPGVVSGCVMVFLMCAGAFVTPQLLGGPSSIMFGNLISNQFIGDNNWAFGATLSVVLMAFVLSILGLVGWRFGFTRLLMGR